MELMHEIIESEIETMVSQLLTSQLVFGFGTQCAGRENDELRTSFLEFELFQY